MSNENNNPVEVVRREFASMLPRFKASLPPHIAPEKFLSVMMTCIESNSALLTANRSSLFSAAKKCAGDGLLPDSREAAILIYKSKTGPIAQYQPMIGGIYKKIRNSGQIASIDSEIVCKNDKFRMWTDRTGKQIEHEPECFGERGEPIGAFAIAITKEGVSYIEVMSKSQIMSVKNVSKSKDSGPWSGPFESEMWRKTVVKRLAKRLPLSTDVLEFLKRDDEENYQFEKPKAPSQTKAEELTVKLEAYEEAEVMPQHEDFDDRIEGVPAIHDPKIVK